MFKLIKNSGVKKNKQIFLCLFFLLFLLCSQLVAESNTIEQSNFSNSFIYTNLINFQNNFNSVPEETIQMALQKADELKLYNQKYWHILLHYKKKGKGYKSIYHGENFFLSEEGQTNPKAELEADLQEFLKGNYIKQFPARYKWLKSQLETENQKFFDETLESYSNIFIPDEAYLLFPAGYLQNPASIFGHTLILFSQKGNEDSDNKTLAFIAEDTSDSMTKKVVKGMAGSYDGLFTITSYEAQIGKYNEKESRDIWEYKLNLSNEQLNFLYYHAIELTNAHVNYIYLNQNCTSELLEALRAAYPEENFLSKMGMIHEPVEAVKILHKKGLIGTPAYRPSVTSKLEYEKSLLSKKEEKAAADYNFGRMNLAEFDTYFTNDFNKLVGYTLAVNAMKIRVYNQSLDVDKYMSRAIPIAEAAEYLDADFTDEIKNKNYPHLSHDLSRFSGYWGRDNGNLFTQYYFRLAGQDFMDIDKGIFKNTQLSFLSGSFSYYPQDNIFSFDTFDLVNIKSISPSNRFFLGNDYELIIGLEKNQTSSGDSLAFRYKSTIGQSLMLGKYNQIYTFIGFDSYTNFSYKYWIDFLPGISCGWVTAIGPWKQHIYGAYNLGCVSELHSRFNVNIEESLFLFRNCYLSGGVYFTRDFSQNNHKETLGLNLSF